MVTTAKGAVMPLVVGVLTVANMLLVYFSFAYFVERRPVSELALLQHGSRTQHRPIARLWPDDRLRFDRNGPRHLSHRWSRQLA